ncbi:MAG: hypothetical protein HY074_03410, partial [Deltaproteobacteria bacterium]|nr:hypothetical protein [Deltaproteobacteria bacterium]
QPTFNVLQTVVNGNSTQIKSLSSNDTTHSLDDAISSLRNLLDAGVCGRVTNHKCTFSQGYSFGNPVWQILVTITDGRSTQDSRMYYNGDQNDVLSHFRMLRDLGYCNQPVLAPPPALVVPVPQVATKVPAK